VTSERCEQFFGLVKL